MKKVILLAVLLATAVPATPLIGRSAAVSKPFQAFVWANAGYNKQAKVYDWTEEKYVGLVETDPVTTYGAELWGAVGLPFRNEVDVVVPAWAKTKGSAMSNGIGDVTVMLRHGLPIPGIVPFKAALALAANVPTSDRASSPALDDGTVDIGAGLNVVTSRLGPLAAHARAGYWLSGKTDDTTKVGNLLEYIAVLDYNLSMAIIPELAVSGSMRAQKQVNGEPQTQTESSQHFATLLVMTKPLPFLVVRPKVGLPLEFASKGGSLSSFYAGLDVWATFP